MNIENVLNKGINILQINKISNPQLDSEILLSSSIERDKKHIILNPKELLNPEQLDKFKTKSQITSISKKPKHHHSHKSFFT